MKSFYIVQPYAVGSKLAKSKPLALIIPAPVREKARIAASSTLMLQLNEETCQITVDNIDNVLQRYKNEIPVTKNCQGYPQQELATR